MKFGEKLQILREKSGLSQSGLATASGVNVWTIRGYEQDRREPSWEALIRLARALGVTVEEGFGELVNGDDPLEDDQAEEKKTKKPAAPKKQTAKKPANARVKKK